MQGHVHILQVVFPYVIYAVIRALKTEKNNSAKVIFEIFILFLNEIFPKRTLENCRILNFVI